MFDFLARLFDSSGFPPRWRCGSWTSGLGWLHIISDLLVWASYTAIPIIIGVFILRRRDVPFPKVLWLFVAFILSCGLVHLVEASIFWWPHYRLSGLVKLMTAVVSMVTVGALIPTLPKALAIASPSALQKRIDERTQELNESAAKLQAVFETAVDGIFTIDMAGTIEIANPSGRHMFGCTDMVGQKLSSFIVEPQSGESLAEFAKIASTPGLAAREATGKRANGSRFALGMSVGLMSLESGNRYVVVIRDITGRKQAEEAFARYARALELSNADLQDFAAVASHDLQEPLRKVAVFSELLEKRTSGSLDEESRDYVLRMKGAAHRMTALISSLLELSKATARQQPFRPEPFADIVKEAVGDLDVRIRESGGRVEIGPLPVIESDRFQIRQLFQNLIGNALKFRRLGVPPVVKVRSERTSGGRWSIIVSDNGIGFDPKDGARLFKPFTRLNVAGAFEGSGIGLAICRKIVARHDGEIRADSTPGQGSTFVITLPEHAKSMEIDPEKGG